MPVYPEGPVGWRWPTANATILQTFSAPDPGKRGLDIGGQTGDPVMATAAGRVVYSGSGLPRYGKLIIVKHSDVYLSAYAHNEELLVKDGDNVNAGQRIATMGSTGTSSVRLHFEIRENGKPVDPLRYLPARR
jgi:lipoprotein NlpD